MWNDNNIGWIFKQPQTRKGNVPYGVARLLTSFHMQRVCVCGCVVCDGKYLLHFGSVGREERKWEIII